MEPVVTDPAMRRLYDLAGRVAHGGISVLLLGETGTGKEVLTEYIHRRSPRMAGPLVRLNCAALSESLVDSELFGHERGAFTGAMRERRGLLESADGGTAFLDEVGELPATAQAKLLRVLEAGQVLRVGASTPQPVDVRFVAATNRDLDADVAAGRFRRDLFFRLAGVTLSVPPLRERRGEIEALARCFAADTAARLGRPPPRVTGAALAALRDHAWVGNVRELKNVIERAVLLGDDGELDLRHLPFGSTTVAPRAARLADQLAAIERDRILAAIRACGGNQTRAAEALGMPRRTLIKRLDHYGVERPRKR